MAYSTSHPWSPYPHTTTDPVSVIWAVFIAIHDSPRWSQFSVLLMSLPRQLVDRFVITKQSTEIFYIRWPLPNTGLACRKSKHSTTIHQLYSNIRNPPLANPIPTVLLRPLVVFCNAVRLLAFVPKSYPFISASYPSTATMRRMSLVLRLADNKPCEIYALVPIVRCWRWSLSWATLHWMRSHSCTNPSQVIHHIVFMIHSYAHNTV